MKIRMVHPELMLWYSVLVGQIIISEELLLITHRVLVVYPSPLNSCLFSLPAAKCRNVDEHGSMIFSTSHSHLHMHSTEHGLFFVTLTLTSR